MTRAAWALAFVFLLGAARLLAPTSQAHTPALAALPGAMKHVPAPRARPARPSPRTAIRPSRPSSRLSPRPETPSTADTAPPPAPAAALTPFVVPAAADAPLISASVFHLSPVPPLPPASHPISSGRASHGRDEFATARRPASLVPLYGSFATLQALDYHSTRRALESGTGREANPLMREIVKSPPAFIAVKAAATASVIVVGEKLWKKNRTGAVLFVAGANVAMGVVVARNYR